MLRIFQDKTKWSQLQSQDSPNALNVVFKFGIIIAKKGENVRDRGSNMSNMVNNLRLKLEAQGKAWRSFEEVLAFTCPTPLSGICIGCYLGCCILVHLIFVLHHASSWLVWRKVSKLEKFLQRKKLSILIDYNLTVIDYNKCLKLKELSLVSV